jgi:predicted O-methyltransferase YrrM
MKTDEELGRREFLGQAGGVVGLLALGSIPSSAVAQTGNATPPSKADPARIRKTLDGMESRIGRYWSTPRMDAQFLNLMIKATRAVHVLEVGTSQGYSAIWMGLALEETGGRLTTIEIDSERHALAQRNVREAGLAGRVTLIRGDAHREIAGLKGLFDFVFLDADKDGQMDYFKKLYPKKIAPGAIIAVHNAISEAGAMKDYMDTIRKNEDFDTVIVSTTMDDGIALSYRHRFHNA